MTASTTETSLADMPISKLSGMIANKQVSPVEVLDACLDNIAAHDETLHGFITLTESIARDAAKNAESEAAKGAVRGPFHGIPFALKDIIDVAGVPTTAHSKTMVGNVARADATVTSKLQQAGGVLVGKTATFEFALGGPSWDLPWPPALNPWNRGTLPGGSSSGSGTVVAARFCHAAVGTDTGGSVRWPAAVTGLVGLKPTYGRISRKGVLPNTFSHDNCGPMTRTVEDCAIMLGAMAGHDAGCPGSMDAPVPDYRAALTGDIRGLRIGFVRHWYAETALPEVVQAVDTAIGVLKELGAVVEEITLAPLADYVDAKTTISMSELYSIHRDGMRNRYFDYGKRFRNRVLCGALIRGEDYVQAQRRRAMLTTAMLACFDRYDILATAGWQTTADAADPDGTDFFRKRQLVTMPFSLTGIPAVSVPCGFAEGDLPLSLQLAGRPFDEAGVLAAAYAYEQATPWHDRKPDLSKTPSPLAPEPKETAMSDAKPKIDRAELAVLIRNAGIEPTPEQFEEIADAYGHVCAMLDRLHRDFPFEAEPAHVFTPLKF